ncbi:MAG TPA: hypothetical protein VIW73_02790 [Candidatus Cybelea sp.]
MNRKFFTTALGLGLAMLPLGARADTLHQDMIMEHGAQVMPFDQSRAMHMFLPSATGGVVEIVVHDMDVKQIQLVRSHLLQEAGRFARGDYSDPAYIHGKDMPGLAQLASRSSHVSIRYFETPTGAAVMLDSTDQALVAAIHQWLAAQQHDHSSGQMNHCDMKM